MFNTGYSKEIAKEVYAKLQGRGWNVYRSHNISVRDPNSVIHDDLACDLVVNQRYVLLPRVSDPHSPRDVRAALDAVVSRLAGRMPTIAIGSARLPITGFSLRPFEVKLHTPCGSVVPYSVFVQALDSLVDTNDIV